MTDLQPSLNRAWHIGAAIEAGMDEQNARTRIEAGGLIAPAAAAAGGIAAASVTGFGGVGLAMGGGAVGIGAATAVAAPAVAAGAVGYGIYKGVQELKKGRRDQTLRRLIEYYRATNQPHNVDRIYLIEGMGRLEEDRSVPTHSSVIATLRLVTESTSTALVGLFCSPKGEFVLTYDLTAEHWAYVRLISETKFSGGGVDLRGQNFQVADLDSLGLVIRVLEREGLLARHEDPTGEPE